MSITVEYDRDADADVHLYEELYAGLPVPAPDLTREDLDRPAAVAVARRPDGELLGWAEVHDHDDRTADAQWLLVSRERERISTGRAVRRAATDEDLETVVRLLRGAANSAAAAGRTALEWDGSGDGLDARIAAELGAEESEELGRRWTTTAPLADWRPQQDLPPVTVRPVPGKPDARLLAEHARFYSDVTGQPYTPEDAAEVHADLPPLPQATLDLLTPAGDVAAQATAVILDETAHVDVIFRSQAADTEAAVLTAFVAELVALLRREHPGAGTLEVQEHGDPVTAEALAAAGLCVTDRWCRYRMGL
ncbi:hypothetical protein I5Q34_31455 [Streptomyces sp. AV19]|uniref:hypothetical protein n=1 Tax=Streptomyces sp. AV19 TaxID=2793068 RepID=UPI0018FE78B6|nr:hypothetical protein [Streptomyces sp. AV19]MBH1938727.1 hypothetical protein [Streptomyces sp. AV19]MDG4533988.1 hypothetical protein [Streptomyces sp. AV19]